MQEFEYDDLLQIHDLLKPIINIALPIALAVILPALSLYSGLPPNLHNGDDITIRWGITSISLYLLWYLLWYLSNLSSRHKWLWMLFALVMIVGVTIVITQQLNLYFTFHHILRLIFAMFLISMIQYAMKTQQDNLRLQLEKEQIQTENYKAQLKALYAKIDPHFLFNSMNTLRSMVRNQHHNSERFVTSLSDFYRQTLKYNEDTSIQLSEELEVLESYLFVMKSRNEDAISFKLNIDDACYSLHLPTLALQVVVENCFKHNSMTSKQPLQIEISSTDDAYIMVRNNVQPRIGEEASSGYGLDLLRKRYELMNIQKGVIIQKTADYFTVQLKLIEP